MKKKCDGFSLIELMVVVAIIGVLASIALPAYESYVRKSKRTAAEAVLAGLANRQQAYLMDNRSYASKVEVLDPSFSMPAEIASDYSIAVTGVSNTPPTFTITATPISSTMLKDTCGTSSSIPLSISQSGERLPAGCW